MLHLTGGKVLWKYMKPLFTGKILYTPNNSVTRAIVSEANSTFDNMASMLSTLKSVSASQEALLRGINGTDELENLQVTTGQLRFISP